MGKERAAGRGSTPSSCQTYVKIGEMEHEELSAADMSSMVSKGLLSAGANNTPCHFLLLLSLSEWRTRRNGAKCEGEIRGKFASGRIIA